MLKAYTLLGVLLCLIPGKTFSIDVLCGPTDNPTVRDKISLVIFNGNNTHWISRGLDWTQEIAANELNPALSTVLYIHGFMENSQSPTVHSVVFAYLRRGDVNVLALDWSQIAGDINYYYVAKQVPSVGKTTADLLTNISSIIDLTRLHIVGHSLGAHVASYIARNVNTNIPRITGLDPAFPLFYPSTCHVQPTDAAVVAIIHTDAGVFGTPAVTGTVDFFPNRGVRPQPGCPIFGDLYCSHQRSVRIFVETVKNPRAFQTKACVSGGQETYDTVFLNDNTPSDRRGTYCFTTNSYPTYV